MNDMHSLVKVFPKMLELVLVDEKRCQTISEFKGICIVGMGGSAIAGQYVQALLRDSASIPIVLNRESKLPAYVDNEWVVISISYSGNTAETLSAHFEAVKRKCPSFIITSGGPLKAKGKKSHSIALPPNWQPRAAFPFIFSAVLNLTECLLGEKPTMLGEISGPMIEKANRWDASPLAPKEMAKDLLDELPVFIGSGHLCPVAYRAKCQINENAKATAFYLEIPEANHNDIESIREETLYSVLPLILRSGFEDKQLSNRLDVTAEIYEDAGYTPINLSIRSDSKLEEMLFMTYYLDLVSVELADLRHVDPMSVDRITSLKQKLG